MLSVVVLNYLSTSLRRWGTTNDMVAMTAAIEPHFDELLLFSDQRMHFVPSVIPAHAGNQCHAS